MSGEVSNPFGDMGSILSGPLGQYGASQLKNAYILYLYKEFLSTNILDFNQGYSLLSFANTSM